MELNNLAEERKSKTDFPFSGSNVQKRVVLDNGIYVTIWLHIDGVVGKTLTGDDATNSARAI
jgi:hypothetical protein